MSCEAGMPPSDWPSGVTLDGRARTLELVWDGQRAALSHQVLRRSCRCSVCENARRTTGTVPDVAADVALVRVEPLGSTALQLFFSDGHERGIYPWTYLKQIAFGATLDDIPTTLTTGWRDE